MHPTTVGAALDAAAARWGDAEGWTFEDERVSFNALRERADAAAKALLGLGLGAGDIVATWMPNRPEWLTLQMACAKAGVVLTGLNTRFKVEEVRYALEHSGAKAVFYTPLFLDIDFRAILAAAGPLPALRHRFELHGAPQAPAQGWEAFLALGGGVPSGQLSEREAAQVPADTVLLKYTSGTTSFPKGVLINHLEALYWGAAIFDRMGVQQGEAVLNTQPFYHAGGSCGALTVPLTLGCRIVSPLVYNAARVLELIERERCAARTGAAAMYIMEMADPAFRQHDLSSLRAAWCVGPPAVFERIRSEMGVQGLVQPYGSTEVGGTCASIDDPMEKRIGTCGRPLPGTEIRIVAPDTARVLAAGETGEICQRGWWRMNGYYRQPEETAKVMLDEGWVRSGDLGFLDEEGFLHFAGRLKDTIRPGGENVSAAEVEAYLLRHPAVRQVAVIGVPDERLGEAVMAVVEPRDGAVLDAAVIIEYCRGSIASYKVPRHVRITHDWPMTGSGKIQKFELRRRYAAEFER
jgi:fatty-acyl-CoA synthase/long-chain acyl-CoA synthetase